MAGEARIDISLAFRRDVQAAKTEDQRLPQSAAGRAVNAIPHIAFVILQVNLGGVLESIDAVLTKGSPHPAASGGHPPPAGEG